MSASASDYLQCSDARLYRSMGGFCERLTLIVPFLNYASLLHRGLHTPAITILLFIVGNRLCTEGFILLHPIPVVLCMNVESRYSTEDFILLLSRLSSRFLYDFLIV